MGILAAVISISMVGAGIIGLFFADDPVVMDPVAIALAEYENQKERLEAMAGQSEIDPDNLPLLRALAGSYYEAGTAASRLWGTLPSAIDEMYEHFTKATETYQKVLVIEQDADDMLNLAAAATMSGNYDLAEQTYQDILARDPDSFFARVGYGSFLYNSRQDYAGAIEQMQQALELARDDTDKEGIQEFIDWMLSEMESEETSATPAQGAE